MACNTLTSILKGCSNNQGGIFSVWINDSANVTAQGINLTAHTITATTTSPKFTAFEFNRNVGSSTVEPKIDLINGSTYYEVKTTLVFHRREAAKSRALQILAEGQRFLDIMYLDANGEYWYISDAQLDGGAEETGVARGDGSKYTVTFMAQMDHRPYEVLSTIVSGMTS
jgi:hypothetical protein